MAVERPLTIVNKRGLHVRPATQFAEVASRFSSSITVGKDGLLSDAKSILDLLMLAAAEGVVLHVRADGPDAEQAVAALEQLVAGKFGEE
ncbi:MAG: HPr family phosphocarrier protein [Planctomycetes bacterium]|nr:HPr family phosphocarrier protein [Planctomycetota bacterium]